MEKKELYEERTLYRLNKGGSVQQYILRSYKYSDGAFIETSYGVIGGAIQVDEKPIYPKNVGRANETTPVQQAVLEANSKANKLLDKSYVELDLEDYVGERDQLIHYLSFMRGRDPQERYLPMLADKDPDDVVYPCYVQRKYDGLRGLTKKEITEFIRSRKGKVFDIQHLVDAIKGHLPRGYELDGELYLHGRSLQQIVSIVKNIHNPEHSLLCYRVYDLFGDKANNLPYHQRKNILNRILRRIGHEQVQRVPTYLVHNRDEMMALFTQFREEGYEGAMARTPDGTYKYGDRPKDLVKVKDFEEEEFELIGMEDSEGRDKGCAVFVLKTPDGVVFNSRPMGTREQRREYLRNEENYIGEMVTVIFQYYTDEGKPAHSRCKAIRDYE